jgi:hypothetical protein
MMAMERVLSGSDGPTVRRAAASRAGICLRSSDFCSTGEGLYPNKNDSDSDSDRASAEPDCGTTSVCQTLFSASCSSIL